jgi:hypothetical protein
MPVHFAEGALCESLRVALSPVDESEDYQRQRLLDVGTVFIRFGMWQALSNAAPMMATVSGL